MDLINRQAAIDVLDKIFPVDPMRNDYTQGITCGAALAKEYIKQLPSAEPKKGRWVNPNPPERSDGIMCSECGYDSIASYNYCPNCGSQMWVME